MYKFFLACIILIAACNTNSSKYPQIKIYTNYGDIEAELYPDKAPKTVATFLRYVDSGIYTNTSFYRVVITEGLSADDNIGVIQGGTWPSDNKNHPFVKGIPHESTKQTGLSHTTGTLSLARTDTGTASTEFFICIGDQSQFDAGGTQPADKLGYPAFGKVTSGMKVVREIQKQYGDGDGFRKKIEIYKIKRM
jgi:peptidyl-prolyl cis-trans isomerase A (cyclophilin A)